jgi:hypothetical protein
VNLRPPISYRSARVRASRLTLSSLALSLAAALSGCSHMHPQHHEYVYVTARQTYLHDRVAAVSNRVGEVTNGEKLEVMDHGRRFLKVKTPKNEVGWLVENAVIDQDDYDKFTKLADQHKNDPVIATAVLRDDVYLHQAPGRETQRFYLLPGNAKVQLLVRASVPKEKRGTPRPPEPVAAKAAKPGTAGASASPAPPEPPPVMEDWWLVRDAKGQVGWLIGGRADVDVPDVVAQYAEGQRIVGAYVLTTIHDDNADTPDHEVPEYVMLLEPYKSGLPYDFDQVRVFTWSRNHHRYETAFRLRPIAGFLPVNISKVPGPGKDPTPVPAFGIRIAANDDLTIDPDTGVAKPAQTRTINFEMLDTVVKRIGPDLAPISAVHTPGEKKEAKKPARRLAKKGRR